MTDAPEAVGAGRLQRFQDRLDPLAQVQVGVPDDGGSRPSRAVDAARAGGGQPLDELDLADGRISSGPPARYIARASMNTVVRDVVPALDVGVAARAAGTAGGAARSVRRSQKW